MNNKWRDMGEIKYIKFVNKVRIVIINIIFVYKIVVNFWCI